MKINGTEVSATEFAWDGCHKIYLIDGPEGKKAMEESGWTDPEDYHPIKDLPHAWAASCDLKFINNASDLSSVIGQFEWVEQLDPDDPDNYRDTTVFEV